MADRRSELGMEANLLTEARQLCCFVGTRTSSSRYQRWCARKDVRHRSTSGTHHVEAEAERDTELGWVEGDESKWLREAFCCSEVNRIGQSDGLAAGQRCGSIKAALVDWDDVKMVPREADGVFEIETDDGLIVESVDSRQCLGESHCRRCPDVFFAEDVEDHLALWAVNGESEQRAGVKKEGHPRSSRRTWSMREPAQTGTGAGARNSVARRGGMTAPAPISRSRSGASASSGPS